MNTENIGKNPNSWNNCPEYFKKGHSPTNTKLNSVNNIIIKKEVR